jgi:hypothetical protein
MSSPRRIPVTETSNDLTKDIDMVDCDGIVKLLRQSDMQLFSGYSDFDSVYDSKILQTIDKIVEICKEMFQNKVKTLYKAHHFKGIHI